MLNPCSSSFHHLSSSKGSGSSNEMTKREITKSQEGRDEKMIKNKITYRYLLRVTQNEEDIKQQIRRYIRFHCVHNY